MSSGDRILKAIFDIGQVVDTLDQVLEEQIDDLPSEALREVSVETSAWWKVMEMMHQRLHGHWDVPMDPEYCGEDPRVEYSLAEGEGSNEG